MSFVSMGMHNALLCGANCVLSCHAPQFSAPVAHYAWLSEDNQAALGVPKRPVTTSTPPQGPTVVAGNRAGQKPGQPYVVFVVNNQVSTTAVSTAASLARGGRDALEIVTFVPTEGKRGEGEELLGNLKRVGMRSMADVKTTCVVGLRLFMCNASCYSWRQLLLETACHSALCDRQLASSSVSSSC